MSRLILTNCNILDVENETSFHGSIVIEDDLIKEVIKGGGIPSGDEIIDLNGKTVMPGLFNCHTHMTADCAPSETAPKSDALLTMDALNNLEKFVKTGVTMIRDVGSNDYIDIDLRDHAAREGFLVPDMQVSGRSICMTGGHGWTTGRQVDGADEARKAAREQLRAGADWIKVMATGGVMTKGNEPGSAQLTEDEMRAACEEAHKAGCKVATHAQGMEGIKNALRAGVDSVEHGFYLDEWCFDFMKEHNVFYTPTLSAMYWIYVNGEEAGIPDFMMRKVVGAFDAHKQSFLNAYQAGVKIVLGTDAGTPFNYHDKTAYEMILMRDAGMSVWDALKAGTINAAELMDVKDKLGSITVGKRANLAVFNEDPSVHLETTMDCQMTIIGGKILFQK